MNLASLIGKCGRYKTACKKQDLQLPALTVLQRDAVTDIEAVVYEPVVCLILQGRKETSIGDQFADLGPGDVLLVSHDLPVQSRITIASPQEPYLAVILHLDPGLLRGLNALLGDLPMPDIEGRSLSGGRAEPEWIQALERYLDLHINPLDAQVLGPAILREIHYRLLVSPIGYMLRRSLVANSHASRVARAIARLRRDFHAPLTLPELARSAGMSATSFHQHFKAVTGTTPLQYQKDLRLIAARALVVEQGQTVTEAAFAIGYESPTHFSRDYRRKFGRSPSRDARSA